MVDKTSLAYRFDRLDLMGIIRRVTDLSCLQLKYVHRSLHPNMEILLFH
jgi:hypothetical protein